MAKDGQPCVPSGSEGATGDGAYQHHDVIRFEPASPALQPSRDAIKPVNPSAPGAEDCVSMDGMAPLRI